MPSGLNIINFYQQTGNFSVSFVITPTGYNDTLYFGLSGDRNINFKFQSGKFYDSSGRYVASYKKNFTNYISGDFGINSCDLYFNGNPLSFENKQNCVGFKSFYSNSSNFNDIKYNINGFVPDFYFPEIDFNLKSSTAQGFFSHNGLFPTKITDGNFTSSSSESFAFDGFSNYLTNPTGNYFTIFPNHFGSPGIFQYDLNLKGDFGSRSIPVSFNITDTLIPVYNYNLAGANTIGNNSFNGYYFYVDTNANAIQLNVELEYLSGYGKNYIPISGTGNFPNLSYLVSNVPIRESGFVSGTFNILSSGYGGLFDAYSTGYINNIIKKFQWATGNFFTYSATIDPTIQLSQYLSNVSGYATGVGYSGTAMIPKVYYTTSPYDGENGLLINYTINDGSGTYLYNGKVTGNYTGLYSPFSTYSNSLNNFTFPYVATGNLYTPATGGLYWNPGSEDVFFIGNVQRGIEAGYDFQINDGISGLGQYLLNNIDTHHVIPDYSISNAGFLALKNATTPTGKYHSYSGFYVYDELVTTLHPKNLGTSYFTAPLLLGQNKILKTNIRMIGNYTGDYIRTFSGYGFYTQPITGEVVGLITGFNYDKSLETVWNLYSGSNEADYNYLANHQYNNQKYWNPNGYVSLGNQGLYLGVGYNNNYDNARDVAKLSVKDISGNIVTSILISGVF